MEITIQYQLKILLVNSFDNIGGAAKAAFRIFDALRSEPDIQIKMVVMQKNTKVNDIYEHKGIKLKINQYLEKVLKLKYPNSIKNNFSAPIFSSNFLKKEIKNFQPDLINIHWTGNSFMQIEDLKNIQIPVYWTQHDEWSFTGGCHISFDCNRFIEQCGRCPILKSQESNDLSSKVFNSKYHALKTIPKLSIISPSRWMFKRSKQSSLLKNRKHYLISNTVEDDFIVGGISKSNFISASNNKICFLFGANNASHDDNKGMDLLLKSLSVINQDTFKLIIFGNQIPIEKTQYRFEIDARGVVRDKDELLKIYRSADVAIVPSRHENFSNMILESLASGLPVIAFDVGGNKDLISHKNNGYLCENYSSDDLRRGITWMLNHSSIKDLSLKAVRSVSDRYSYKVISNKYIKAFNDI